MTWYWYEICIYIMKEISMPLKDAERFIREIAVNNELRRSLYTFDSSLQVKNAIEAAGYKFKLYEYEETITHLKTESPTEEQAIMLDELLMWWKMLMYDGSIVEDEQSGCSPSRCATCGSCG